MLIIPLSLDTVESNDRSKETRSIRISANLARSPAGAMPLKFHPAHSLHRYPDSLTYINLHDGRDGRAPGKPTIVSLLEIPEAERGRGIFPKDYSARVSMLRKQEAGSNLPVHFL